nr:radical SAM protein [uncultured Flavobacterium sp.]
MKYSQFNSIIPFEEKYALFNSLTQKFIVIDPLLKDLLLAAKNEGISGLKEIHPSFFLHLEKERFLIPKEVNEVDEVKRIVKEVDENHHSFLLTINPTMNCNFKCWYCYETHVKKSSLSNEISNSIGLFIEKTARKEKIQLFNVAFFGGEPLLYFKRDVAPIILKLKEECVKNSVDYSISFTTNGYLIDDHFISFFKENNLSCSLQITLDGYREKHDLVRFVSASKGSYNAIIENIKKLLRNEFPVRLRINYTAENIEDTFKIGEEFADISNDIKKRLLLIDFHRVWQDAKVDGVSLIAEENIKKIRETGINVKYLAPNNVLDSCYADKRNSAVINYNGDIFKCTARDFTTVKRAGYLNTNGELIWENDYLEKRMNAKFQNKPCLSCRLMPICNGGCSQHALEALGGEDYCVYHGDENEKDKVVKSKIDEIIESLNLHEV